MTKTKRKYPRKYRAWGIMNTKTGKQCVCVATREDGKDLPLEKDTILNLKGIRGFRDQVFAGDINLEPRCN